MKFKSQVEDLDCDNPPSSSSTNTSSRQEAKSSSVKVSNSYSSTNDDPTKPSKSCRRGSKRKLVHDSEDEYVDEGNGEDTEEAPEAGDEVIT